jgi:hypothetical protein
MSELKRGEIIVEQAYAQGKMLDHSSWRLPRNITPSDTDFVLDIGGCVLFAEFSSQHQEWVDLQNGQRWAYESQVRHGPHIAALCFHCVRPDRAINTTNDVVSFQVMVHYRGSFLTSECFDGQRWERFVKAFGNDPIALRGKILSMVIIAPRPTLDT